MKSSAGWCRLKPLCCCALLGLVMVSLASVGCERRREPIKVGFAGPLTGRLSDLGIGGRNGVLLAVEELNAAGGIRGRPVELIARDDQQDPKAALQADRDLIDQGVVAIIGHMTSTMSLATLPLINKERVLMISPTTSTNRLTGLDDHFLRVMAPNKAETDHLARYAREKMGLKRLAAVYDLVNRAYTEEYFEDFRSEFEKIGGRVIRVKTFTSGSEVSFAALAGDLLADSPDGLLVVAGALDTAMICQHARRAGSRVPILSCAWAMTQDLISNGGSAVEGVMFSQLIDQDSREPSYLDFKRRFKARFGCEPDFGAIHGFEAASVLLDALSENGEPDTLKSTILKKRRFKGVQVDFEIDPYGDARRRRFLITVQKGEFKTLSSG